MKRFIYQSPKDKTHHSTPIAADNAKARMTLEGKGWRIVETLGDDVEAVVETVEVEAVEVVKPAQKRRRKAAD